jgi:hypothetical protein
MGMDPAIAEESELEISFAADGTKESSSRRGLGVLIAVGRVHGVFSPLLTTAPAAPAAGSGGRGHPVTRRWGRG